MYDAIPAERRDAARAALAAAFGPAPITGLQPVRGGASGALTYRVETGGRAWLMRLEAPRDIMRDPARWYACMRIAAEAGVAPPVLHTDESADISIMAFIEGRPLADFPGGPQGLARAQGELIARLQAGPVFPPLRDYPELLEGMLAYLRVCGRYRPELFEPHAQGLARIREAYPWDPSALVASHNDPNPGNFIFDGERLWLVDWETAFRNDPLADVAILAENLPPIPGLEDVLVRSWLGREADAALRARFTLMRQMTRLYYGALMLSVAAPAHSPEEDLTALTEAELQATVAAGKLTIGPQALLVVGKTVLARFLAGLEAPAFKDALAVARAG